VALYKMMVRWPADTGKPADDIIVTPWLNDHGVGTNPDSLCSQVLDCFMGSARWILVNVEAHCYAYEHTPGELETGPPKGSSHRNVGALASSNCPREQALCLSFYAVSNEPRRRGRLYLPCCLHTPATENQGIRPGAAIRGTALNIATRLSSVGGVDVDWVVHSVKDDASYTVTNGWVDDEWDTQRRRGMKSTTRDLVAVSG
jgi:hypothetical protein